MIAFLVLVAASTATPPVVNTHELAAAAGHAVQVGRLEEARAIVARAVAAGAAGAEIDRVVADLSYATGNYPEALARYEVLLRHSPVDPSLFEPAGLSALRSGKTERASTLLRKAVSSPGATWRSWNALGVVADLEADWTKADECYDHAAALAPTEAGPVNNRGWSLVLRGSWREAAAWFDQAVALDPKSQRSRNNLELARAALAAELPRRLPGESDSSWAARLNDAGIASAILGDRKRAAAAFTQALNVSGTWYVRAANNLEALGRE